MHALVLAVLMGRGGLDELGQDADLDEPDTESRQAPQGVGSEGRAEALEKIKG